MTKYTGLRVPALIPPQDSEEFTECLFKNYEKPYFIKNVITPKIISEYGLLEHCLEKKNIKMFEKFLNIALDNKDIFDYSTVASEALWVLMEDSLFFYKKVFFDNRETCKKWVDNLLELSADTDLIDYYYREMYYNHNYKNKNNYGSNLFVKSLLKSKNRLDIFKFNIRKWPLTISLCHLLLEIKDIDYNKDFSEYKELCQNYDDEEDKEKNKGLVTIYGIIVWIIVRRIEKGCYYKLTNPFIDECTKRHMSDVEYHLYREPEHNISDILITETNYKLISSFIYYMCGGYITFNRNTGTFETQIESKDRLYQQIKEENYKFESFNVEKLFYEQLCKTYISHRDKGWNTRFDKQKNIIIYDDKYIDNIPIKIKFYDNKHKKKLREYIYDILDKKVLYKDLNKLIVSYL